MKKLTFCRLFTAWILPIISYNDISLRLSFTSVYLHSIMKAL